MVKDFFISEISFAQNILWFGFFVLFSFDCYQVLLAVLVRASMVGTDPIGRLKKPERQATKSLHRHKNAKIALQHYFITLWLFASDTQPKKLLTLSLHNRIDFLEFWFQNLPVYWLELNSKCCVQKT